LVGVLVCWALMHEGSHGIDQRAAGEMTRSRAVLRDGEVRAFTAEAYFAIGSGWDINGLLTTDGKPNAAVIGANADEAVRMACAIPGTCSK